MKPTPLRTRTKSALLFLIALAPVAYFFHAVYRYSFNIPITDDYDAILRFLLDFLDSGRFTERLGLIFSQHAEHRIVLDRIITLAVYYLRGNIDFRILVFIGNLALIALAAIFCKTLEQKEWKALYFIPVAFLLFQPQYNENIFVAMAALSNFYVLAFAFLSLYILTRRIDGYFFLAVAFAVFAAFTQGGGLIVFIVGAAVLVYLKRRMELTAWLIAMGASCGLYFYGYFKPAAHPSILKAVEAPLPLLLYFFAFIGSSIGSFIGLIVSPYAELPENYLLAMLAAAGAVPFAFFIYLTYKKYYKKNAAVYSFFIYLFLTVFLASLTRSGFGVWQSLASRYKIISILFFILMYIAAVDVFDNKRIKKTLLIAALCLSIPFNVISYKQNYGDYSGIKKDLTARLIRWYFDRTNYAGLAYYDQKSASELLSRCIKRRIFTPDFSPVRSTLKEAGPLREGLPVTARVESFLGMHDGNVSGYLMEGWAFINNRPSHGDKIYIALKSDKMTYVFDTVSVKRRDVTAYFQMWDLDDSGFLAYINVDSLKSGDYAVSLYVKNDDGTEGLSFTGNTIRV